MAGAPRQFYNRLMRVLYVIDSLSGGGAERSLAELAPHFAERGVQLHVAYLYERDNVWRNHIEATGARVSSLEGSGGSLGRISRVRRLIRTVEADVVHTTLYD